MWRKLGAWVKAMSAIKRTAFAFVVLTALTGVIGATTQQPQTSKVQLEQPASTTQTQAVKADTVVVKTVTETKAIPFTTTTVDDTTLNQGTTVTQTKGVDGVETITYKVTYTNGQETDRSIVSDEVTTQPVNEVIAQGTKAPAPNCPNGTYTNSDGMEVCRPYESPSAPSGATAQCRDGSYSFSQHRSGTCSHHGGVASWL
ncbi:MAG TPA: DUF3761 domain-containing protein [Candidatus Saccharimonadales bacterium]|nr:DUF3761 domain-containing protein [Candidatus Saccharimonadales bacterium]